MLGQALSFQGHEQRPNCGIARRIWQLVENLLRRGFAQAEQNIHHLPLASRNPTVFQTLHGATISSAGKTATQMLVFMHLKN
jgi:hypothetical protein